jgi:hypothetical protein
MAVTDIFENKKIKIKLERNVRNINNKYISVTQESSAGITTVWMVLFRSLAGARDFPLFHCVQNGPHRVFYAVVTGALSALLKAAVA